MTYRTLKFNMGACLYQTILGGNLPPPMSVVKNRKKYYFYCCDKVKVCSYKSRIKMNWFDFFLPLAVLVLNSFSDAC